MATVAAFVVGCGGDDSSAGGSARTGTPPGTFTIAVTASAGSGATAISNTLQISLTVTR